VVLGLKGVEPYGHQQYVKVTFSVGYFTNARETASAGIDASEVSGISGGAATPDASAPG
jgi:hypothetical protein